MPEKNKTRPVLDRLALRANPNIVSITSLEEEKEIISGWARECISVRAKHGYPVLLPSIVDYVKSKGLSISGRMASLYFYSLVPDQKDVAEVYFSFMGDEDGITPINPKDNARFREVWSEFCSLFHDSTLDKQTNN